MLRILATAPLRDGYVSEWSGLAEVTTLNLDGTFDDEASTVFDGAFIGSEAFPLGLAGLTHLYGVLTELVLAKRVRWVHLCASGIDGSFFHTVMRAAHTAGAKLTHCPGVYAKPIGQYCLAHMLAIAREVREHAAQQAEQRYASRIQRDVRRMTVGIVGAGGIGEEVARLAKAFGMRVLGFRRSLPSPPPANFDALLTAPEGLHELLSTSDFVIISLPLTPATRGMIGKAQLALMRPSSWLINISRGAVVDEEALAAALALEGASPAGAVLDVFAKEPLSPDSPLWSLANCIVTPHDSWRTDEAIRDNHMYFLDNCVRLAAGEQLKGLVPAELLQPALDFSTPSQLA